MTGPGYGYVPPGFPYPPRLQIKKALRRPSGTGQEQLMLTDREHETMNLTTQLYNALRDIIHNPDGDPGRADLHELTLHLHAIQNAILSQAAARLLGGRIAEPGELSYTPEKWAAMNRAERRAAAQGKRGN